MRFQRIGSMGLALALVEDAVSRSALSIGASKTAERVALAVDDGLVPARRIVRVRAVDPDPPSVKPSGSGAKARRLRQMARIAERKARGPG